MSHSVSRRSFTLGSIALIAGGSSAFSLLGSTLAAAQSATAEVSAAAGMTYPDLTATITDDGIQLSATDVPAGYVLLTVDNQSSDENSVGILGPGPNQTMDDLQQAAAAPSSGDEFPPFLYQATIVGGPGSMLPGETRQAVIKLTEGDWAAFPEGPQQPVFLTASAGDGSDTEPTADVTITEVDFAFGGFAQSIPAGPQTWKVVNVGEQPHMLEIAQVPAGTTLDQMFALAMLPDDATPPPGMPNPEEFQSRGGVMLQSSGTSVWPLLDLPEGRYAMVCFVSDPAHGGIPHAMEGMIAVFDVGSNATPTS